MKRMIGVLFALVLLASFPIPVAADEGALYRDFEEAFTDLCSGMPEEVSAQFGDILNDPGAVEKLRAEMGMSSLWTRMLDTLEAVWPSVFSMTVRLLGLTVCAGIVSVLHSAYGTRVPSEAIFLCTTLCFALAMTGTVNTVLISTEAYLTGLTELVSGMSSVVCAVLAASGQLTTAAVSHTALMLLFTLLQNISTVLLLPAVRVCFCVGIVSAVGGPVKLENAGKCLQKILTVFLSLLTVFFVFVVGVQTALAKSTDSLSVRTVKFAFGNVIPMVGGALSDAITTVYGSLDLIRTVTGGLGVFSLVVLLLPVAVQLLLYRISFGVCKGVAEMVGCVREAHLIGEMHSTVGFLLAAVSVISVLFLFILSLFTLIGGIGV